MLINKTILQILIILFPSIIANYFTLTFLDHDKNLSNFSTVLIISFNLANFFLAYIFYKTSLKVMIFFSIYCLIIVTVLDFSSGKLINSGSIIKDDDRLGWILRKNKNVTFNQQTFKGTKYKVKFLTSNLEGVREFGNLNDKKRIVVLGDSYTAGPYSSNNKMYYSYIKDAFKKDNKNFEWFVIGGSGYGTIQQYLILKEYYDLINPDIILHQFCVNDFFDNNINISSLSTTQSQYFRRPYFIDGKIEKMNGFIPKLYRFFYKNSFIFKKLDQIYTYKKIIKYGRYTKNIDKGLINESIEITSLFLNKIRDLIGPDTPYFSINCADEKKDYLSKHWVDLIKNIKGFPIIEPSNTIIDMKKNNEDVNHEDGGHLNDNGNKIYGELTAIGMLKIINE